MTIEKEYGNKHIIKALRKNYQKEIEAKCREVLKANQTCKEYLLHEGIILGGNLYKIQKDLDEDSYLWILNIITEADEKIVAPTKLNEEEAQKQGAGKQGGALNGAAKGAAEQTEEELKDVLRVGIVTAGSSLGIPIGVAMPLERVLEGAVTESIKEKTQEDLIEANDSKQKEVKPSVIRMKTHEREKWQNILEKTVPITTVKTNSVEAQSAPVQASRSVLQEPYKKKDLVGKSEKRLNVSNKNESITTTDSEGEQSTLTKKLTSASQEDRIQNCGMTAPMEDLQAQVLQLTKQVAEQKMVNTVVLHTLGIPIGGLVGYFIDLYIGAPGMVLPSAAVGYAISITSAATYYYFDSVYAYVGAGYLLTLATTTAFNHVIGARVLFVGAGCIGVSATLIGTLYLFNEGAEFLGQLPYGVACRINAIATGIGNTVGWVWENYPTALVGAVGGLAYAPVALYVPRAVALSRPWAKVFGLPASRIAKLAFGLGHTAAFSIVGGVIGNYWDHIKAGVRYCAAGGVYTIKTILVKDYCIIRSFLEEPREVDQSFYNNFKAILEANNYEKSMPDNTTSLEYNAGVLKGVLQSIDNVDAIKTFLNYKDKNSSICEAAGKHLDKEEQRLFYKETKKGIEYLQDWSDYALSFVSTPATLQQKPALSTQCLDNLIKVSDHPSDRSGFEHVFQDHPVSSAITTLALAGSGLVLYKLGFGLGFVMIPPLLLLRGVDIINPVPSLVTGMVAEAGVFGVRYFKDHEYTQGIKAAGIGSLTGVAVELIGEGIKCAIEGCLDE